MIIKRISFNKNYDHEFRPSTKEESDQLEIKFTKKDKSITDIIAFGETSTVTGSDCNSLIPCNKFDIEEIKREYPCHISNDMVHYSAHSSFNCILESLGKPNYIVVTQIKKEKS